MRPCRSPAVGFQKPGELCGIPRESRRKTAGPASGQTGFDVSREPIRQIETKAPERIEASDEIPAMRESAQGVRPRVRHFTSGNDHDRVIVFVFHPRK